MSRHLSWVALALALIPLGAESQDTASRLELRFGAGVHVGTVRPAEDDPDRSSPMGPALSAAVSYRLAGPLAAELGVGFTRIASSEDTPGSPCGFDCWTDFELTTVPVTVGLRAVLASRGGAFRGWATAGAGAYFSWAHERMQSLLPDPAYTGPESVDEREAALGGFAGIGLEWRHSPRLLLGFELRYVKTAASFDWLDYSGDGLQLLGGVTFQPGRAATAAAAPAPAAGEWRHARLELRLRGGVHFGAIDRSGEQPEEERSRFDAGPAFDVAVSYRLHRNLAAELAVGWQRLETAEDTVATTFGDWTEFEMTTVPVTAGLRAGATSRGGRFGLWVTAGAGAYFSSVHERMLDQEGLVGPETHDERAAAFGGHAGVAFDWRLSPGLLLGVEVRYVKTTTDFERLDYSGDGLQMLGALTIRPGAASTAQ